MTTANAIAGLTWITARHPRLCDEDGAEILAGDRMAIYGDEAVHFPLKHSHTTRHYCEPCGHLLEDSLTTIGED